MSHTALILFLTTSLALILVPGPDMIYVVTRGVAQGKKAGLFSAAGVCSGICVHTGVARSVNRVTGSVLIVLGLRLAFPEQK